MEENRERKREVLICVLQKDGEMFGDLNITAFNESQKIPCGHYLMGKLETGDTPARSQYDSDSIVCRSEIPTF